MNDAKTEQETPKGNRKKILTATAILAAFSVCLAGYLRLNALERRLQRAEDVQAIERLQYAYNYYVEHMLKQEIIDCFAESPDVLLDWIEGKWKGKDGVRKYFDVNQTPPVGFQHQLIPAAGLITVAPDGYRARGRWYAGGIVVNPESQGENRSRNVSRSFINGIYEMEYTKENGVWKILAIQWTIPYGVRVYDGWISPEDIAGPMLKNRMTPGALRVEPDAPMDPKDLRYITGHILPFHFTHPVTGKPTSEAKRNKRLVSLKSDATNIE